ncbi:MAG: hypothetical protein FWE70_01835, partial [Oscillospiraceae bacterium]|nr:hypothetical protein [Oscillospiraceae bacterium]
MDKISMDAGWRFCLGNMPPYSPTSAKSGGFGRGAADMALDDSGWALVDVPHDYMLDCGYVRAEHPARQERLGPADDKAYDPLKVAGYLPGRVGWYRKRFEVAAGWEGKRVYLHFDGVYRDCTLYLNHYHVGGHKGGYTGFYLDVTDFIEYGGVNLLAVRVDATEHEGWWYEGGGIYRHAWLCV